MQRRVRQMRGRKALKLARYYGSRAKTIAGARRYLKRGGRMVGAKSIKRRRRRAKTLSKRRAKNPRVTLRRSFWGHKPGTKGRVKWRTHKGRRRGILYLRGSPPAYVKPSDEGDLFTER